ncbi:MAG TPA: hypothetical protein VGT03_10450 [Candidatus Acidoferrales bacterium]|nr:hypothetical protein [Candidatus Acidoferrales bacterium]
MTVGSLGAQESNPPTCSVPPEAREKVSRYLDLALSSATKIKSDYDRSQLIAQIAGGKVCVKEFRSAAHLSDLAYPSGSDAADGLGRAVAQSGSLADVPALEASMTHGTSSFLYGLSEGLAIEGRFAEADSWARRIPSPEVREEAESIVTIALYRAGKKDEALARSKASFEKLSVKAKAETSLAEIELQLAASANDWLDAHSHLDQLPAGIAKRYMLTILAAQEAEKNAPDAQSDLLAASAQFNAKQDPPYEGYLIAAHLAGIGDFPAAIKSAEAVRDDEWNQKCWSTIASFQAEAGMLSEARASIAKIGRGDLEHALGLEAEGRDMARIFVASGLSAGGKPDAALTLLAEREDKADYTTDREFVQARVQALAVKGDLDEARQTVETKLATDVVIDEQDETLAESLATNWYAKSPSAVEQWIFHLKNESIRASCWIALASAAMGQKPVVPHYFVNWD